MNNGGRFDVKYNRWGRDRKVRAQNVRFAALRSPRAMPAAAEASPLRVEENRLRDRKILHL